MARATLLETLHFVNIAGSADARCNLSSFLDTVILLPSTAPSNKKISAQVQQTGCHLYVSVLEPAPCRSRIRMCFHPFSASAVLLGERATLSASQTIQPSALRANASPREPVVQAHSCWLLVTVCLPCSRLEEQNVKTSLNVRPHMKLVTPRASILRGARISRYRTRRRKNVLPFSVHAEPKNFASPRDHHAPSSP